MNATMRRTDTKDLRANRSAVRNSPAALARAAWKRRVTGDFLLLAAALTAVAVIFYGLATGTYSFALAPSIALAVAGILLHAAGPSESARTAQEPAGYAHNG